MIDKPAGLTSHDVVARVRRILHTRKVGHAGTLDPMATGLLLIGAGQATRLLGYLARADKEYLATIRLGASTLTDDAEGELLHAAEPERLAALERLEIESAIERLSGALMQVPSSVSAIKVGGERAYARVRAGESVELAARPIRVDAFEILGLRRNPNSLDLDVRVACSSGTYVRALARDLGQMLVVGGHLTSLRRTRIGPWHVDGAVDLAGLADDPVPADRLVSLAEVAADCFGVVVLDDAMAADVRNGRPIPLALGSAEAPVALLDGRGEFLALAFGEGSRARYLAVFAAPSGSRGEQVLG